MKIIFLDIDGVLNCERFYHHVRNRTHRLNNIDPKIASMVVDLCKITGARIVVSSSWRFGNSDDPVERLRISGIKDKYVVGVCSTNHPNEFRGGCRGDVIQRYIDNNNVDRYVILDDDDDMLEHQKSNLIQTSRLTGFTKRDMTVAIKILK